MWTELASPAALDPRRVGGKAASVARLYQAGLPVPPGWCLPVDAEPAADAEELLLAASSGDASDAPGRAALADASDERAWRRPLALLRAHLASLEPSTALRAAVQTLCATVDRPLAVRSSALGESTSAQPPHGRGVSLSGLLGTFLGITGEDALLGAIRACWLSRWSDNVLRYALARGLDLNELRMGVLVQPLVSAEAAGGARSQAGAVTIEATWGFGRGLAEGAVVPDVWRVEHDAVREVRPGHKPLRLDVDSGDGERWRQVPEDVATRLCLDEPTVIELARLVEAAEQAFGAPVEVEWAVDAAMRAWLLQARPIAVRATTSLAPGAALVGRALEGLPAAPGQAIGRARVVRRVAEVHGLRPGEVLVADVLRPGALAGAPALAGLVLEAGGTTSHAATLARERGIPAVLAVRGATRLIPDGAQVLVDGDAGRVLLPSTSKDTSPTKKRPR